MHPWQGWVCHGCNLAYSWNLTDTPTYAGLDACPGPKHPPPQKLRTSKIPVRKESSRQGLDSSQPELWEPPSGPLGPTPNGKDLGAPIRTSGPNCWVLVSYSLYSGLPAREVFNLWPILGRQMSEPGTPHFGKAHPNPTLIHRLSIALWEKQGVKSSGQLQSWDPSYIQVDSSPYCIPS